MCEEPGVQREWSGGVDGMTIIGKINCVRLGEKLRKGIEINFVLADMEKPMTQSTHGANSVE